MKLTINREPLLLALTRTAGVVSRRGTIEILTHVLLDAKDGALTIRATNLDLEAVMRVACDVETPGTITAPAASLLDIAKSLADGAQIEAKLVKGRMEIRAGKAKWKLPTLDAKDFPSMEEPDGGWAWSASLAADDLGAALSRVSWSMCSDLGKQFICGLRVEAVAGELWFVTTNGAQVSVSKLATDGPDFSGLTIPPATVAEMVKFCAGQSDVVLSMTPGRLSLRTDGEALMSKVVDLRYAEWRRLLGFTHEATFTVDRRAFSLAIRRAMIGATVFKDGHAIKLTLAKGAITVAGHSTHFEASDETEIDYAGDDVSIGMNALGMIGCMDTMKADAVSIAFTPGKPAPLRIYCDGDDSVMCASVQTKA